MDHPALRGRSILVVENEPLISLDIVQAFERAGAHVTMTTTVALLSGCVDSQRLRSSLGGPAAASEIEHNAGKQTLSSKVLGALALERVTNRKPDPARLYELR